MKQLTMLTVAAFALTMGMGCGGTSVQFARVDAVKSAAVVGVSAALNLENRNQGSGAATLGAGQEMVGLGSDAKIAERKVQGNKLYDVLASEVGASMGWTVKTRDEVVADAANKAIYDDKIGKPNSLQLGGKRIYVPGIVWAERVRGLDPASRGKLIAALGVDALVFVHVDFVIGKTGPVTWKVGEDGVATISGPIPGTSAAYPKAVVRLEVFDATFPNAIWSGRSVGETASLGVTTTMGIEHKTDLVPILEEATKSAWAAVVKDYKEAKAQAAAAAAAGG